MPNPTPKLTDLGFSTADAEDVQMGFDGESLSVSFRNWKAESVRFICGDTLAFRWQQAEYCLNKEERDDSVYEILGSEWLRAHQEQDHAVILTAFRHFKMNFNAVGVLEVLCIKIERA